MSDLWSVGSVVSAVHARIDDIPSTLSGTNMNHSVMKAINYVTKYTGKVPGSVDISLDYQDAILFRTCGDVLNSIQIIGVDANSFRLGDFSTGKGSGSNVSEGIKSYERLLRGELRLLGRKVRLYKANS